MPTVAIVTGAAVGIGAATASLLAGQGFNVLAVDSRRAVPVGDGIATVVGDVSDPTLGEECVRIAAELGQVEVLVNCAATRTVAGAADTDRATWQRTLDVNLTGPFLMSRAVLPQMLERGSGAIVNVGSVAGEGRPNLLAYCASKGGLAAMTKAMALDVAHRGVRVNLVVPGITVSSGVVASPDALTRARVNNVLGRPNRPEEIAEVIGWLCLSAPVISGAVVEVGTLPRYPQEPAPIRPAGN